MNERAWLKNNCWVCMVTYAHLCILLKTDYFIKHYEKKYRYSKNIILLSGSNKTKITDNTGHKFLDNFIDTAKTNGYYIEFDQLKEIVK